MSGGRYEHAYHAVAALALEIDNEGGCYCASIKKRKAFKKHLELVARTLKAIEWNDSDDGDEKETALIDECLGLKGERK